MKAFSYPHHHSSFSVRLSSLTLLVVILSSLVWLVATAAADGDEEEEDGGTCETAGPRFHPDDDSLLLYPYDSLSSTQDEAKRIAESIVDDDPLRSFVVTTREQTNGRGTNGRIWMGQRGNVFCTIGIRQKDWMASKVPLTLLPLKIGSLVAENIQQALDECYPSSETKQQQQQQQQQSYNSPLVTVKWPNDVLVNEEKISGVLIESSSNGWFLIGIGINLAYAPTVAQSGPNRGRPATSLVDVCPKHNNGGAMMSFAVGEKEAEQLGIGLAYGLNHFLIEAGMGVITGDKVLQDWKQWIDWDMELVMRDTPGQERVKLVGVLPDGRIEVQNVQDGRIRTLVSDYFL